MPNEFLDPVSFLEELEALWQYLTPAVRREYAQKATAWALTYYVGEVPPSVEARTKKLEREAGITWDS